MLGFACSDLGAQALLSLVIPRLADSKRTPHTRGCKMAYFGAQMRLRFMSSL